MTLAILNTNAVLTMTSREIAELTGKSISSVHRDIKATLAAIVGISDGDSDGDSLHWDVSSEMMMQVLDHPEMNGISIDRDARGYITCFHLTQTITATIVSGYNIKIRHAIVKRWKELEASHAKPSEMSRLEILTLAIESEKGRLVAIEQRDQAIATKAQIGSKREATAMATASAAKKESAKLKALMGEATENASIIAVQNKTGVKTYKWRDLKNYCEAAGLGMGKSFNPGLQLNVNTYPAGAWFEVYGVDLVDLFGEVTA